MSFTKIIIQRQSNNFINLNQRKMKRKYLSTKFLLFSILWSVFLSGLAAGIIGCDNDNPLAPGQTITVKKNATLFFYDSTIVNIKFDSSEDKYNINYLIFYGAEVNGQYIGTVGYPGVSSVIANKKIY